MPDKIFERGVAALIQPRAGRCWRSSPCRGLFTCSGVYPEFFRFFIIEQHFGRFLTPAIHPEPLYYYVPVLLGLLLPWTWLLPWTLAAGGRWRDPDERFLVIWAAVILVFFSLSRGKLVPYILPALLPLALLVGHGLARLTGAGRLNFNSRFLKTSLLVWAVTGVVLVALSCLASRGPGPGPGPG